MLRKTPGCVILALSLVALVCAPPAHAATVTVAARPPSLFSPAFSQDAAWIKASVRPDGAIATGPDKHLVLPYVANYAAMGLARAAADGDADAAETGWRWLTWYQSHEDSSGYVHDYQWSGPTLIADDGMDSTDAYAGTFLCAAEAMYRATQDPARLQTLLPGIDGAVRAIESTQDVDGLTFATPSWHVKYLMDQAETYAGLMAASRLALVAGDVSLSLRATLDAQRMHAGVDALWNERVGAYDWAIDARGLHTETNWSLLYPDAMQQVWAVAFGLVDPARARTLVSTLTRRQPGWSEPTATSQFSSGMARVGYWPAAAWALRRIGASVAEPLDSIRSAAATTNRAWPFTTGVAGQLMVAEAPKLNPPS